MHAARGCAGEPCPAQARAGDVQEHVESIAGYLKTRTAFTGPPVPISYPDGKVPRTDLVIGQLFHETFQVARRFRHLPSHSATVLEVSLDLHLEAPDGLKYDRSCS